MILEHLYFEAKNCIIEIIINKQIILIKKE